MRRIATTCLTSLLLVAVVGCEDGKRGDCLQQQPVQTAGMQPDYYAADPVSAAVEDDYAATDSAYGSDAALMAGIEVTGQSSHVVAKGDTLFSLARQYYSDQRRWKDIYAANGDQVHNPDMIFIGQVLAIP